MFKGSFDSIFYPRSIAVIGASNNINKIGGYVFSQILNKRDITPIPINPRSDEIQGVEAYESVLDKGINSKIDLVIIAIPKVFVLDELKKIVKAKIKNVVIITAGFKEIGGEGVEIENEIRSIVSKNGLNLIGPNCLGFLNAQIGLNCSFARDLPKSGDIALISQSGAVIDAIVDWSFKQNIGFSKIVSLGNMAGVDHVDLLNYLKDDRKTKAIVFYLESLDRGKEFCSLLREVSRKKPVIIIKPGTSDNAKTAIGSHTGSLAQDNELVKTLILENNGILVETLHELYSVMIGLSGKFDSGRNTVILTNAGGPGVIATDELDKSDFDLYRFNKREINRLQKHLPLEASVKNPVDVLGDAKSDRYVSVLEEIVKMDDVDNVLVLLTPQIMTDCENIAKGIIKVSKESKKNIFASFLGEHEVKLAKIFMDNHKFPSFDTPNDAIFAMNLLSKYKRFDYGLGKRENRREKSDERVKNVRKKLIGKAGLLDFSLTREILESLDIKGYDKQVIRSTDDLFEVNLSPHSKYVLKVDSKDLIHKKDVGGVVLNVTHLNVKSKVLDLIENVKEITNDFTITIERQVSGQEVIVGLKSTPSLGNFIIFGMGGTFVSIFKDVNIASCPLNKKSTEKLVLKSRVYEILKGFRGSEPIAFLKLYSLLIKLSYLQEVYPEIVEVDLNPVICDEDGVYLVDVKLLVR